MAATIVVISVVSAALLAGMAWGLSGKLSDAPKGFMVALAGGALIVAVTLELVEPAARRASPVLVALSVLVGAIVFTFADRQIARRFRGASGAGLLLAVVLDGVPENLALGVSLIGAEPLEVAALAGSILLSNLPEAAGGADAMRRDGMGATRVALLWTSAAVLLALAALAGNLVFAAAPRATLAPVQGFAAGAVVASLATEVFPEAFREDRFGTGIAVALGLVTAFLLGQIGNG